MSQTPDFPAQRIGPAMTLLASLQGLPGAVRDLLMNDDYPFSDDYAPVLIPLRNRLKKLLWWDCASPLSKPLPAPEEFQKLVFDPLRPTLPPETARGYRIFTQQHVNAVELCGKSTLRIYNGGCETDNHGFTASQELIISVSCDNSIEANVGGGIASRSYCIAQLLVQILSEISLGGLEPLRFEGMKPFCEGKYASGYVLRFSIPGCT